MDCLMSIDAYRTVKVESVEEETPRVKTYTFRDKLCNRAEIGQYIMLWIQGVDEIPLSLSAINRKGLSSVTVEKIGEATEAIHIKKTGEFISVRGPYGNSFRLIKGNVLVVGGGIGLAPLLPLLESLAKIGSKVTLIVGARTRREILSLTRAKTALKAVKGRLIVTTDDGSSGIKGLATDPIEDMLVEKEFSTVYTCGPEPMMRHVFEIAESRNIKVQACSERIIRCSVGLCGSCVIGKFRVCKDGPIFSSEQLRDVLEEFGKFRRDFDGSRIDF
ncbi:MAG: dihydroorotate dehydrogenase electron transfer subunit [Candidatus Bathyarchaeota archaeon]